MVHRTFRESPSVKSDRVLIIFIFILTAVIVFLVLTIFLVSINRGNESEELPPDETIEEIDEPEPEPEPAIEVKRIDFQGLVDNWANSVGGNRSVLVYDLEMNEIVGSFNSTESYNTASLYKLFVVYEGYRRLQSGEWSNDAPAGSTGNTILECLDLSIRESNSACAETLWSMIGRENLDNIIKNDFKINNSDISHLLSNPEDILKILRLFYKHNGITNEKLISRMKDSFIVQPKTIYNWRQGLPSGFSKANVYNKVGWDYNSDGGYWNIYHDAAIIEFPEENRHFIIVVMTNRVPYQKIRDFGTQFENYFYKNI